MSRVECAGDVAFGRRKNGVVISRLVVRCCHPNPLRHLGWAVEIARRLSQAKQQVERITTACMQQTVDVQHLGTYIIDPATR